MDEKAVLDRIEEREHAVLLVGDQQRELVVPVSALPEGAKPGQWLNVRTEGGELIAIAVDSQQTDEVRQRIKDKMERLRQRGRRTGL